MDTTNVLDKTGITKEEFDAVTFVILKTIMNKISGNAIDATAALKILTESIKKLNPEQMTEQVEE